MGVCVCECECECVCVKGSEVRVEDTSFNGQGTVVLGYHCVRARGEEAGLQFDRQTTKGREWTELNWARCPEEAGHTL